MRENGRATEIQRGEGVADGEAERGRERDRLYRKQGERERARFGAAAGKMEVVEKRLEEYDQGKWVQPREKELVG